mmetsp:Transcript_33886/g.80251  ORF Transcript_33886/g.80251 Transcript_33886/m.80251 type:complete len:220 (+) Transcript_33886:202-861(+)
MERHAAASLHGIHGLDQRLGTSWRQTAVLGVSIAVVAHLPIARRVQIVRRVRHERLPQTPRSGETRGGRNALEQVLEPPAAVQHERQHPNPNREQPPDDDPNNRPDAAPDCVQVLPIRGRAPVPALAPGDGRIDDDFGGGAGLGGDDRGDGDCAGCPEGEVGQVSAHQPLRELRRNALPRSRERVEGHEARIRARARLLQRGRRHGERHGRRERDPLRS